MEFTITSKTKAKAQKRRIKNESKWVALRTISIVSLVISLVSGIAGIFFVPYERYTLAGGIWVEDGRLYQFIQMNFAGGLNYRSADERANMYIMDLDTIHNAKYDPKSGRIEFNALGEGIFYNDYQAGVIRERWDLKEDFVAIFYDYTEPSLYEYLKSVGIKFSEETIPFKIRDARI